MTLQPGYRFAVAPHFHLSADWPRRLQVGAGVEKVDGCFYPLPSWRTPTPGELAVLVQTSDETELEACVGLFQLPGHLLSEWWKLLEQAAGTLGDGRLPGFDTFVSQMVEFLAFKDLPVPKVARCDVLVSNPGQPSGPMGLQCSLAPWTEWPAAEDIRWPRLWGGINLGDEPTSVVLINLSCRQLDAELRRRLPEPAPTTVGELVEQFLHCCWDYPTVRLILGSGEGYRLPWGGLILDRCASGKQEPDVLLMISHEGNTSA
jgi:hypothetical protein